MGTLRADRITGLGGANAITGSCFFDVKNYLFINHDISLDSDFTIEWWAHRNTGVTTSDWFTIGDSKQSSGLELYIGSSGSSMVLYSNNGSILTANSGSPSQNAWHHIAVVRSSNTIKVYVDGTADSTTVSNSSTFTGFIRLGAEFYNGSATIRSKMHMSNFRIVKGTALYTSNFTPPNNRLENITGTEILCCQSSGNILQEATGKTIVAERSGSATTSSNVEASKFTPNSPVGFSTTTDVGSQYGSTFDGFGNFATSTYMVPPGGNTRERNRGRGLVMAGSTPSGASTGIESIEVQSSGNGVDFGTLLANTRYNGGAASATRGLSMGGKSPSVNTIEFVTIASTSNSIDFGDLTQDRRYPAPVSNDTRAVAMGGYAEAPVGYNNIMDFVTIPTAGNATDFGDTTNTVTNGAPVNSTTRGLMCGGANPSAQEDVIQFITIASTGNAQDFGDLTLARRGMSSVSSSTRGVLSGGYTGSSPNQTNVMDYITIASAGNAIDFGDSTVAVALKPTGQICSRTRGVFVAGSYPSQGNVIDFVTIATTGNASDFGDLLVSITDSAGACSDSHGGLS
tara:strand:+ start:196 stop:1905 length:1710 start_codon:yes stop_codon:yes gene_type:complete